MASLKQRSETLTRFAALLGSFRLKDCPVSNGGLSDILGDVEICSVPSLSLATLLDEQHATEESSKDEIEDHAAKNLARPLLFKRSATLQEDESSCIKTRSLRKTEHLKPFKALDVKRIPPIMLSNLEASFFTLLEARLRAYVTFLGRHGLTLASSDQEDDHGVQSIETKVVTLLEMANAVSVENLVTSFQVGTSSKRHVNETSNADIVDLPLEMKVTMDVNVPTNYNDTAAPLVTFELSTTGHVAGTFPGDSEDITEIAVHVDTHKILEQLVETASTIMSSVLKNLEQPDGSRTTRPQPSFSDDTKQQSSPRSLPNKRMAAARVPSTTLKRRSISTLPPETCANIVDCVIGPSAIAIDGDPTVPRPSKCAKVA